MKEWWSNYWILASAMIAVGVALFVLLIIGICSSEHSNKEAYKRIANHKTRKDLHIMESDGREYVGMAILFAFTVVFIMAAIEDIKPKHKAWKDRYDKKWLSRQKKR